MSRENHVHTKEDLITFQSYPLSLKIALSKARIRAWYNHFGGNVYVSFSGGKDSTVLLHLVRSMYPEVPAVFVNTGLEYPEIQIFARGHENTTVLRPEMSFVDVIKKYGYPAISKEVSECVYQARMSIKSGKTKYTYRLKKLNGELTAPDGTPSRYNMSKWKFMLDAPFDISNKCCDIMKKKPSKKYEKETGRAPFIATMASESKLREQKWLQNGCNGFNAIRPTSQPLSFWTDNDILTYLLTYDVPYCSVYGEIVDKETGKRPEKIDIDQKSPELITTGCSRTGCMFCMYGCHLEKVSRFKMLRKTHYRQYCYCIGGGEFKGGRWIPNKKGLGLWRVLKYLGISFDPKDDR